MHCCCFLQNLREICAKVVGETDEKGENIMVGLQIAILRIEHGLSQAELAKRLCISPSALECMNREEKCPLCSLLFTWLVSLM